jgi:hypothetical protein
MSRTYRKDDDEYYGGFDRAERKSTRGKKQADRGDYHDSELTQEEDRGRDEQEPAVIDQEQEDEVEEQDR